LPNYTVSQIITNYNINLPWIYNAGGTLLGPLRVMNFDIVFTNY
jgi:hypothetical protein